jgi:hypothetical protein
MKTKTKGAIIKITESKGQGKVCLNEEGFFICIGDLGLGQAIKTHIQTQIRGDAMA